MDETHANALQQLAIWQDKYKRLADQHATLLNNNQDLEDRLINVVDKIERDKSLLSDEIDHLAEKLACATNTIDFMKNECARYKSDCMLAVHLLQCQPSFYSSQHLNSLPSDLRRKLCSETSVPGDNSPSGNRSGSNEKKVVNFSASAMTFPPTAVFLPSNEPAIDETPPDEPDSRRDVRDVFLKKILLAPEYETEKLVQCPKCGYAVVKYDRGTQTIGSYLSNSRSAPHLHSIDDDHESESENTRRGRRSTTTSGGGDLLIDLSDTDRASPPISPTFALDDGTIPSTTTSSSHQVRFNVSPGVHHYHRNTTNLDSKSEKQIDQYKREGATAQSITGPRYEQTQKSDSVNIAMSDDG